MSATQTSSRAEPIAAPASEAMLAIVAGTSRVYHAQAQAE
jgi:hypothetical protein